MDTIKIADRRSCQIVAHRGLSGLEPENTLAAFVAAANRSYHGIETDVHVTSDGEIIIIHDSSTGRVAAGQDLSVEGNTFARLREVALADMTGALGRIDLRMPSLREYLAICARYEKLAVLELKGEMDDVALATIVSQVTEYRMLDRLIFISFSLDNLLRLRKSLPHQKMMYLCGGLSDEVIKELLGASIGIDIYYPDLTEDMVRIFHEASLPVGVWTCDNREHAEALLAMGIDYLTTNILE